MKTLVVGMGKTGLSMARHLQKRGIGGAASRRIEAADSRPNPPKAAEMRALLGGAHCFTGADLQKWTARKIQSFDWICASPGAPAAWIKKAEEGAPGKIIGELFLLESGETDDEKHPARLLITGTNGKSTAAALVAELCKAAGIDAEIAGNFGEPLLDANERWRVCPPRVAVLELSSFQLHRKGRKGAGIGAHAAVVLNISPDHLDSHGSFAEYARAKSRIYRRAEYCAVNLDDARAAKMAGKNQITFSVRQAADWCAEKNWITGGGMRFRRAALSPALSAENAAAALALFSALQKKSKTAGIPLLPPKLPRRALAKALAEFPGLPHRRQVVARLKNGAACINDSKSTNTASACFALRQLGGNIILIAGGDGKGQDFAPLARECGGVKKAFLIGKDAAALQRALLRGGAACEIVSGMKAAVQKSVRAAKRGDKILLSPACASLDMYENYAARGDDFTAEIKRHAK